MSRKAGHHEPPAVINTELTRRGDVAGVSRAAVCATARGRGGGGDEEEEEQRQGDDDEVVVEEEQQQKGTTYRISAI